MNASFATGTDISKTLIGTKLRKPEWLMFLLCVIQVSFTYMDIEYKALHLLQEDTLLN